MQSFLTVLLFATIAASVAQNTPPPVARVCSDGNQQSNTNVCVIMVDLNNEVEIIVEGPSSIKGWLAMGFGRAMANSDAVVGYLSEGRPIISDRKIGTARNDVRADAQQNVELRRPFGVVSETQRFVMAFRRPKSTGDSNDFTIDTKQKIPIIWAYNEESSSVTGTGIDARLSIHSRKGAMVLDFANAAQTSNARRVLKLDGSKDSAKDSAKSPSSGGTNSTTAPEDHSAHQGETAPDAGNPATPAPAPAADAAANPPAPDANQPKNSANKVAAAGWGLLGVVVSAIVML